MSFAQTSLAAELLDNLRIGQGASSPPSSGEVSVLEDGRKLEIIRDITGARYKIDGKQAYNTDAGSLVTGILVWGKDATDIFLPLGGRRRERSIVRAPRWLRKDLASGAPVRVFYQRVGELWAVERPGKSLLVRTTSGQAVEFARIHSGVIGEVECERPWTSLSEEHHVGRIALWAQIYACLATTHQEQALAEDIRIAAFAVTDAPGARLTSVLHHIALRGRNIGVWAKRFDRRGLRPMSRAA